MNQIDISEVGTIESYEESFGSTLDIPFNQVISFLC